MLIAISFPAACLPAIADSCVRGKAGLPSVQIYVSPEARRVLKVAGLTNEALEHAASAELRDGKVGCISDNAVTYPEKMEDWVSVSIAAQSRTPAKPLTIDASVRNGPAVTNQIIRWRERRAVGASQREILDGIASVIKNLAAEYGSPEYRKGRRED